jgi:hypothetical protein
LDTVERRNPDDIPARTDLGLTTPTLRSQAANDIRSSASGPIRALGWVLAAWCLGFAAVNIAFQITGRFANGPYVELAAGLAVMDWIVVGLKLSGAAVAVLAANTRAATPVRTVLIWGAFALLGLYSAGNIARTRRVAGGRTRGTDGDGAAPDAVSDSAPLLDADQVARGIADGAVSHAVRLLDRLLDDLGAAGLQLLEGAVEIGGRQQETSIGALGHHLDDGAALVVGDAGVDGRRMQHDGRVGLVRGADRDPAHPFVSDIEADLEAESVAIEGQGGVRVVLREEARMNGDVHGGHASCGAEVRASRFLTGLVTCFATHGGISAVAGADWRR